MKPAQAGISQKPAQAGFFLARMVTIVASARLRF
jgi:hypothetical protein